MKTLFLSLTLAIAALNQLYAGVITQQTAETVAVNFFKNHSGINVNGVSTTLKYTKTEPDGTVDFYVFDINAGKGFVIVTANDNIQPIIGYSDENSFPTDFSQIGIKDWVNNTAAQIKDITQKNILADARISNLWTSYKLGQAVPMSRAGAVAPLLTTTWNQNPYYNIFCPYNATDNQTCVTGCVATAMAQIMKFWNFPAQGTGSYSYTSGNYGVQSANFAATTYNWAKMPVAATGPANDTAVAILSYHCGVSVAMDYGDMNEGGSGAYVIAAQSGGNPNAQTSYSKYFSYNASTIKGILQSSYTSDAWIAAITTELSAGRPIQYQGFDPSGGGHTWVCDGYDANNLLHMNWGWGGYGNGYFSASNLSVAGYTFSSNDGALIGIQPGTVQTGCGVPMALAATSVTTTGATLSWGGVSGATSYNLQYKASTAANWTTISVTGTSSVLTGLTANATYSYQVQSVCASGSSAYSSASTFTTTSGTCGTATGLAASAITTATATISWTAVSGATSYNLQYKTASASNWSTFSLSGTSGNFSGLIAGTTYNIQVQTVCGSGSSAYTSVLSFTTLTGGTTCGTPSGLASSAITTTGATVSWGAVTGAASYNLQYKASTAANWTTVSVTGTSKALTGLTTGTAYSFQVQTVCSGGSSAYSTAATFTTTAAANCGTASGLASSAVTTTTATVSWTAVSGATSYNLQYKASTDANWTTVSVTTTSKALTALTAGTVYSFQVQTVCASGSSAYSTASTFTTLTSCGVASGLTSSSITTTTATVGWTAVSGATSYNLQYKASTDANWTTVSVTTTSKALTALTAGTVYSFQVQTVCASGSSAYSTASTFTTLTSCGVASGLASSAITTTTATVSWIAVNGATSYNLQYKASSAANWTTVSVATASKALTGLTAGTAYSFQVQTVCASGSSAYSAAASFTTTSGGAITYCTEKGNSTAFEYIKTVSVGSFTNTSGANSGYGDFTALTVPLLSGSTQTFALTQGYSTSAYKEYWAIYIDYNNNGVFTDAGEKVFASTTGTTVATTGSFVVPSGLSGTSRMRVIMQYNSAPSSPCGTYSYGETEDYTVNFNGSGVAHAMIDGNQSSAIPDVENVTAVNLIYPNPATNVLHVRLIPVEDMQTKIEIISVIGQVVATHMPTGNGNEAELDVSALQPGIYLVRTSIGNEREIVERIVKQ